MKIANIKWLLLLLCAPFMASCDWADLPAYEDAEISGVQFYHRWASDATDPITGEPVVKEQRLSSSASVDSDAALIEVGITVPAASGDFTESVRSAVVQSKLWGQVTVSTAARVTPVDGSAALGTPDDWTQDRKFSVMAADGTTKFWTIRIVSFSK